MFGPLLIVPVGAGGDGSSGRGRVRTCPSRRPCKPLSSRRRAWRRSPADGRTGTRIPPVCRRRAGIRGTPGFAIGFGFVIVIVMVIVIALAIGFIAIIAIDRKHTHNTTPAFRWSSLSFSTVFLWFFFLGWALHIYYYQVVYIFFDSLDRYSWLQRTSVSVLVSVSVDWLIGWRALAADSKSGSSCGSKWFSGVFRFGVCVCVFFRRRGVCVCVCVCGVWFLEIMEGYSVTSSFLLFRFKLLVYVLVFIKRKVNYLRKNIYIFSIRSKSNGRQVLFFFCLVVRADTDAFQILVLFVLGFFWLCFFFLAIVLAPWNWYCIGLFLGVVFIFASCRLVFNLHFLSWCTFEYEKTQEEHVAQT